MTDVQVIQGDCRDVLKTLEPESVQCVVTSPPYFGLRSYDGGAAEIGTESTPAAYVAALVDIFRQVRRVLRKDGVVWLNLGDSYAANRGNGSLSVGPKQATNDGSLLGRLVVPEGLKPKDLMMIPARVAIALCDDGWYLRSEIVWAKPNPMPESVTDRPTRSHEMVYLLSKSQTYFYDADAIREDFLSADRPGPRRSYPTGITASSYDGKTGQHVPMLGPQTGLPLNDAGRNKRDVWTVPTHPYAEAHFATFPEALIEPCILAGSRVGDTVLDPFGGSGTTGKVATKHRRHAILIELNPDYCALIEKRTSRVQQTLPMEDAV